MATKRKTAAEIREEEIVKAEAEMMEEEPEEETEPAEVSKADAKDLEIAKLKAEISKMKSDRSATPFTPGSKTDAARLLMMAEDAEESGIDPWSIQVDIRVPKKAGSGDDDYWLNVNGISAQVPANGEVQKLKLPWAMTLMDSIMAEEMALDFADSIQVYDPKTNPKPD